MYWVALSVLFFGAVGYSIQQQLVSFLLKPSHGQKFIYTSPIGGLNFLFQVCIYFGLALSIPVMVYQLLKYLEPLIHGRTRSLVVRYSVVSGLLAAYGGAFGYFLGLPVALRFLSHQFTSSQIKPLLTIQEYMSFVTIYLVGSALLFQLPIIILFINRIKPLSPKKLLGFERYMVLLAFIAAAIMTPTTDIFDQLIFALPIMLMYQIAVVLVYLKNRRKKTYSPIFTPAEAPKEDIGKDPGDGSAEAAGQSRPALRPATSSQGVFLSEPLAYAQARRDTHAAPRTRSAPAYRRRVQPYAPARSVGTSKPIYWDIVNPTA